MESILSQDYPDLEYIIIDGGSTDGSARIIRQHESRLSYWISQKDDGQSDAIMKGFAMSTGELFAWVNSDDVLFPGCLRAVANAYVKQGEPDIIHSNVAYLDSDGRVIRLIRTPTQNHFFCNRGVWYAQAPSIFFKCETFRDIGGLNKNYHLSMDFDVWMRMMKAGAKVAHVPRYLGGFRWHQLSKTVQFLKQGGTCVNTEADEICRRQLPRLTRPQRIFWKYILKAYRLLNMDYVRAYVDLKSLPSGRRWQDIFVAPLSASGGDE